MCEMHVYLQKLFYYAQRLIIVIASINDLVGLNSVFGNEVMRNFYCGNLYHDLE